MLSFDHLSAVEFEEFCFDLLRDLGFQDLSWRKGTGLDYSPADQGRDIEAKKYFNDIDGQMSCEHWFVECKHHKKGIPPDKVKNTLAWANSHRPNVLLIVASNFLSNATKDFLESYEKNNKPPFRIKIWENKDLENVTAESYQLRTKYGLATETPFLKLINKYHFIYVLKPQVNTVDYFFYLMDQLNPEKRDMAFEATYFDIIRLRCRGRTSGKESSTRLLQDKIDYETFKKKCIYITKGSINLTFVPKVVSSALAWMFHYADKTDLDNLSLNNKWIVERLKREIQQTTNKDVIRNKKNAVDLLEKVIHDLPHRAEEGYQIYTYMCENLVRYLLAEAPIIKEAFGFSPGTK